MPDTIVSSNSVERGFSPRPARPRRRKLVLTDSPEPSPSSPPSTESPHACATPRLRTAKGR